MTSSASGSATFDNFDEFSDRCKQLYTESPDKTRMVVKYKHDNGMIYLRCTNDRVVRGRAPPLCRNAAN